MQLIPISSGLDCGTIRAIDLQVMKIYTKTGDAGETSLYCGGRVRKTHPRMVACGTLDELNSHLGVVASSNPLPEIAGALVFLQPLIFELGSDIAATGVTHNQPRRDQRSGKSAAPP